MQQVKVKIDKNGKVDYETTGYVGGACKEVQVQMLKVGGVSGEKITAEGCQNEMPAYNELTQQG